MKFQLNFGIMLLTILLQSNAVNGQNFKTVGYLPTYRFGMIDNIELNRLTHLNIAFANPDMQGNLSTDDLEIDPIVEKAHDADLAVFISLAGGSAQLSDRENRINATNRSAFIHNIINYVKQHNLQGVDIDLEWGLVTDDYSAFVLELKDSLHKNSFEMSAALPGTYRYPEITDEALSAFDWINLMAYDLTGPWNPDDAGPHSPYSFAENSINYWDDLGYDKAKITLGVPFYGYDFTDLNHVTSVTYAHMVNLNVSYAQLDQVGQIYYNGLPTITNKTTLALNNVGGIMIWELGQDHFNNYSLLKRIDETIKAFTTFSAIETNNTIEACVFPNPVFDFIQLKLEIPQNIKIILFSGSLKVLKTAHYNGQKLISIGMCNYPPGIYFLSIENESFIKTFKLIKI